MRDFLTTATWFTGIVILPFVGLGALGAYDSSAEHGCRVSYDTSFNGLYLLKLETCRGRLGLPHDAKIVARKPLFEQF